jgi:hypothetical protein
VNDFENEVAPGLPEHLPPGERVLWQGSPQWRALAVRALHARKVAIYFVLLATWHVADSVADGASAIAALKGSAWMLLLGAATCALLAGIAWLIERTTLYTITDKRIVLRFGIALPVSVNIPFCIVDAASLSTHRDGTADLPLRLAAGQRMGYVLTWPHVRPWKVAPVHPMLRAIADGEQVAELLGRALARSQGSAAGSTSHADQEARPVPVSPYTVAA